MMAFLKVGQVVCQVVGRVVFLPNLTTAFLEVDQEVGQEVGQAVLAS